MALPSFHQFPLAYPQFKSRPSQGLQDLQHHSQKVKVVEQHGHLVRLVACFSFAAWPLDKEGWDAAAKCSMEVEE